VKESLLSVGIDIGTSTTQLIFSRLTIENRASSYMVPHISIVDKEVIYRSRIYFTPLKSQTEIDAEQVTEIIRNEYQSAGMKPEDLKTGAVIITGDTARKSNANRVLSALSNMAGDFVVATAGPDLESFLAGKGSGADGLSKDNREVVVNVDIGGGTSNIAMFQKGILKGTTCLDIGGRLIKVEQGRIKYIFPGIQKMSAMYGISIREGDKADEKVLYQICEHMADQLAMALHVCETDAVHQLLYTNAGKALPKEPLIQAVTYSGGVADCINPVGAVDTFQYGDVGILLGRAVRSNRYLQKLKTYPAAETIRATVVGAGIHTTNVSGSTISYTSGKLPMKNIPVLRVSAEEEQEPADFQNAVKSRLPLYATEGHLEAVAISFSGMYHWNFKAIQEIANTIIECSGPVIESVHPMILIIENDIAKVLGNALTVLLDHQKEIICIDGIHAQNGDYIDIGEPIAAGRVVPVVTKTLIFNT